MSRQRTDDCDECTARIVEAEAKMTEARTDAISAEQDAEVTKLRNGFLAFVVVYALTLLAGLAGYYLWIGRNVTLWELTSRERAAREVVRQTPGWPPNYTIQHSDRSVSGTWPSGSMCDNQPVQSIFRGGVVTYYDNKGHALDANNCPVSQ